MKKELTIPIYDAKVTVVVTKDFQEKVLEAGFEGEVTPTGAITLHYPDNALYYTVIFHEETVSPGHIAHEAFHLAGKIMEQIDYKYDRDNDEPMAYLVGFIVDGFHQIIFKKK